MQRSLYNKIQSGFGRRLALFTRTSQQLVEKRSALFPRFGLLLANNLELCISLLRNLLLIGEKEQELEGVRYGKQRIRSADLRTPHESCEDRQGRRNTVPWNLPETGLGKPLGPCGTCPCLQSAGNPESMYCPR